MSEFDPMTLQEADKWNQSFVPPPGLQGFIAERVSLAQTTAVVALVAPDLMLVRDCVVLRLRHSDEFFDEWWHKLNGDRQAIEKAVNHVHLWDFFDADSEKEEMALRYLVDQLAIGWRAKAERLFPARKFFVETGDDYGPTISLYSATPT